MSPRFRRRLGGTALLGLLLLLIAGHPTAQPQAARPKLILLVVIDQFRYDYLPRFRDEYTGGLRRLLDGGAVFTNAYLEHYPTVTAVGHSTVLTGATPAISGIIGNDWYDRATGRNVTSVSDDDVRLLGGEGTEAASPHRLLVSTLGDEMKRALSSDTTVIGASLKDRSAILPGGRTADAAYWYETATASFVSSTYYFETLPAWVDTFNAARHADEFAGQVWLEAWGDSPARALPGPGPALGAAVYSSPYGNDLLERFVEAAVAGERLGQRGVTDVLTVSFSSNDAVGHAYGPDSPEVRAVSIAVDRTLGRLLDALDRTLGAGSVLVALTADHGVAPVPELLEARRETGGRIRGNFHAPIDAALDAAFGADDWIAGTAGSSPYFDDGVIERHGLDPAAVRRVAADAALAMPHVARVYTRDQLMRQRAAADAIDARVLRGFNARRSGDLEILLDPFWIRGSTVATHGTPYNYDAHVPLILMGPGIAAGRHDHHVALNDLAPTLAALLDIEPPSGSVGRVLSEALAAR